MKAFIMSTGFYIPEKIVTNDDLSKNLDTSDEWIYSHTGIKQRHIAADNEAASDLGTKAALNALKNGDLNPEEIDLVLVATSTPDYLSYPATACIVQNGIGAKNAAAFDITAACTGFVYALETAKNYIISGAAKKVLVVGTEVNSRILNWQDRNTCVLFGDGAGAVVLSSCDDRSDSYLMSSVLGSDGSGSQALVRDAGGSRNAYNPGDVVEPNHYVTMDGRKVYNFAVRTLGRLMQDLLDHNDFSINEVTYVVPHQANQRIIAAAAKRIGIPLEKFYLNMDEYANTSAATIPIALHELNMQKKLKRGDLILTIGFGAGLTYGGNILHW